MIVEFFSLQEFESFSVNHVTTAVKAEFGDEYVLVTTDGLEVRDSTGTWGTFNYGCE